MVRRWIALALAALLMSGAAALAEEGGYWEPLPENPQSRYENYGTEWDGSEETIYDLVDAMNDEARLVEEYGSITVTQVFPESGENSPYPEYAGMDDTRTVLAQDDGTRYMIVTMGGLDGLEMYATGKYTYVCVDGQLVAREQVYSAEQLNWYWESFVFPFAGIQSLLGMEQDEAGRLYLLLATTDGQAMEYVLEGLTPVSLRLYSADEEKNWKLYCLVEWEFGPAPEIPDSVKEAVKADMAE